MDELRVVGAAARQYRRVEESEVAGGVWGSDVEPQVVAAVAVREPGRLKDLARNLVDRRIPVGAEGAVRRLCRVRDEGCPALVGVGRTRVIEAVKALVPLRAAVRPGADEVVGGGIDERCRSGVRRLLRYPRRGVVDREPGAVGPEARSAAEDVLLRGGSAVGGRRDAVAGQRIEVDEVLLAAAVEVDVGVASAGRRFRAEERARRRAGRNGAEAVAAVDRAEPDTPLRSGSSRPADEDAPLRIDADVRLAERVDRVGDGWRFEGDSACRRCGAGRGRQVASLGLKQDARRADRHEHDSESRKLGHRDHLSFDGLLEAVAGGRTTTGAGAQVRMDGRGISARV